MQITIKNKSIIFDIQYGKRKNMVLDITPEGHITLKVPQKTSEQAIHEFMNSNANLLLKVQEKIENRKYISNEKSYDKEEIFLYLGKGYHLNQLIPEIPESEKEIQKQLQQFYTTQTKKIIKKRVQHFEKIIGVKAKNVTVVDSPKTWGTCDSNKQLTFNYKLSMAPIEVIDYVVIHELCHIFHMNHDRSFWRKVGMYDVNFKQHQDYLSRFGIVMTI